MPEMLMLIGLAGAGKTSFANSLKPGYVIHSSDTLRKELYGDESDQEHNQELFQELHRRIKRDLAEGKSIVYDATNLKRKRRMAFLGEIKKIPCKKSAYMIMSTCGDCLERNTSRERKVPAKVIIKHCNSWQPASTYEGFDSVNIRFSNSPVTKYIEPGFWEDNNYPFWDFDQENSHHSLTLGRHLKLARDYIRENWPENKRLEAAAALHDIGKPYTKSFVDRNGNLTVDAHYYNHHNVSAYESLFYLTNNKLFRHFNVDDCIYIANLIERHMAPYMEWEQSGKARDRDVKLFGEEFISDLEKLHEADLFAH